VNRIVLISFVRESRRRRIGRKNSGARVMEGSKTSLKERVVLGVVGIGVEIGEREPKWENIKSLKPAERGTCELPRMGMISV